MFEREREREREEKLMRRRRSKHGMQTRHDSNMKLIG
jgi:hypothetical protein